MSEIAIPYFGVEKAIHALLLKGCVRPLKKPVNIPLLLTCLYLRKEWLMPSRRMHMKTSLFFNRIKPHKLLKFDIANRHATTSVFGLKWPYVNIIKYRPPAHLHTGYLLSMVHVHCQPCSEQKLYVWHLECQRAIALQFLDRRRASS